MNFLIIQESGRHQKNREFRESLNLNRSLNRLNGIESKVWGLNYDNFTENFDDLEKWSDVILILENYTSEWLPTDKIKNSKKIKLFWSIDSHCILDQHIQMCKTLNIDILLNSTESYIPNFKNVVKKSYWFPNAYPSDLIYPLNIQKTTDIGFCGNLNNRTDYINFLDKYNIKKDIFVIGDEMVKSINQYKIHFNRNISNDINYRTFETTGCGTLLLTNYTPNLEQLFKINEEIIVYDNIYDLDDKVHFLLNNEEYRKKIEYNGLLRAKSEHTYDKRSQTLLDIINTY